MRVTQQLKTNFNLKLFNTHSQSAYAYTRHTLHNTQHNVVARIYPFVRVH